MIDPVKVEEFLSHRRIAVIGASADRKRFGNTVYREMKARGYEVAAVNPKGEPVEGDPCYPDLASVPGPVDGVMVMVHRDRAADAVREALDQGVPRVWLFQGLGGAGAVSEEAVALCRERGVEVVEGACPMMFLEPVGWFHRLHRSARHMNGSVGRAA